MIEKHHIVFKSQMGLDYELNYKYLTSEAHRGNDGPHRCRETDLMYKRELQRKLENLLTDEFYTEKELIRLGGKYAGSNTWIRKIKKTTK